MSITVLKIPAHGSALSWTGQCGLLALGYFVTGKFGLMLPYIEPHITLLWLPTGLAVAALLRWGMAVWPGITLGVLALAWSMESEPGLALGIAAGNTLGPLLAAGLLRHYHFRRTLDQTRDIVLLVAAAVTGMLLSASGGVASLYIFDVIPANDTLFAWLAWWAGDSVGVLLATPLLLNMTYAGLGHIWQQKTEYVIWLALTCVLGWGIFIFNTGEFGHSLPLVFLMLPMVVWAAMRFDITGASAGTLACMLIAAWATSHGLGPFHRDDPQQGLMVMWVFFATLVLVQLAVAALQTQRKAAEERMLSLAFFDPLTHLPNRNLLQDRLRQALYLSARNKRHGALMFLDLDHFKNINDTYGHDAGDHLLKEVARRLLVCVRQGDTVSRLSGDEFVIVLENLDENAQQAARQAEIVAEKIRAGLAEIFHLVIGQNHNQMAIDYYSSVSIGVSLFRDQDDKADELLKRADLTMYQAKSAGRNAIRFFDPAMQKEVDKRAQMESYLRHALEKNELRLFYQMQVDQHSHATGCEALLRWQNPALGAVSPADFIPLAEDTGLILCIGKWVIDQACQQLQQWSVRVETSGLSLAINVSARQFRELHFVADVATAIKHYGVVPSLLKLELTESVVLYDVKEAVEKMHQLKKLGVTLSLDDFGTGYSSLSYLQRLPLDQLKIDQSFVRDLTEDTSDAAIVRTIITLGNTLGLDVIAEGVETREQYAYLVTHGCTAFQGYLFARPEPVENIDISLIRRFELDEKSA